MAEQREGDGIVFLTNQPCFTKSSPPHWQAQEELQELGQGRS